MTMEKYSHADAGIHPVLGLYESVADTTTQMLAAAHARDWQKLAELEAACARYAQAIAEHAAKPLTAPEREKKLASIRRILAHDREIRNLVEPWMARLTSLFEGRPL